MERFGFVILLFIFASTNSLSAQDHYRDPNGEEKSFFEQRAKKDAAYEQSLILKNQKDELDFWKDQKRYEKDLEGHDAIAYSAYMKGKKDAYTTHTEHCGSHCSHSEYYFQQVSGYLGYPQYDNPMQESTFDTEAQIGIHSLKVGIFR